MALNKNLLELADTFLQGFVFFSQEMADAEKRGDVENKNYFRGKKDGYKTIYENIRRLLGYNESSENEFEYILGAYKALKLLKLQKRDTASYLLQINEGMIEMVTGPLEEATGVEKIVIEAVNYNKRRLGK